MYVTWQVEDVVPGVNAHGLPEKPPAALEAKLTEPAGADFVPVSVSDTVTEQVLVSLIGNVDGEQLVTCVEVVRFRTVNVCPVASELESCTDPLGEYEAVI